VFKEHYRFEEEKIVVKRGKELSAAMVNIRRITEYLCPNNEKERLIPVLN